MKMIASRKDTDNENDECLKRRKDEKSKYLSAKSLLLSLIWTWKCIVMKFKFCLMKWSKIEFGDRREW